MENNRLINTGENAAAVGGAFALKQRPEKCHHANFSVCGTFSSAPAASRWRTDSAGTPVQPRGALAGN